MTNAIHLYPYEVSHGVELTPSDFDDPVKGISVEVRNLQPALPTDLDESGAKGITTYDVSVDPWDSLTFKVVAQLPATERERILPPTSTLNTDTQLILSITCPTTKFRHTIRMRPQTDGVWQEHITIKRHDVLGYITLRPQLIRTSRIPTTEELAFATEPGTVIAFGEPLTLYVDSPKGAASGSSVMIRWEDFGNSDQPWRREHSDDVYHVEPLLIEPRLYLNSRYAQLREILESDAKRGIHAVLRDLNATMIAQSTLLQLSAAAITSLEFDEESESVNISGGWRRELLRNVLPALYPEEPSEEDRLRRAAQEAREFDGAASMFSRLGSVVQDLVASYKPIEAAVRVHEASRDEVIQDND